MRLCRQGNVAINMDKNKRYFLKNTQSWISWFLLILPSFCTCSENNIMYAKFFRKCNYKKLFLSLLASVSSRYNHCIRKKKKKKKFSLDFYWVHAFVCLSSTVMHSGEAIHRTNITLHANLNANRYRWGDKSSCIHFICKDKCNEENNTRQCLI